MKANTLEQISSSSSSISSRGDSSQPRIAVLVNNPCIHDSRVIKEAEAFAGEGWYVKVFCRNSGEKHISNVENGVVFIRIPWLKPFSVLSQWLFPKSQPEPIPSGPEELQISPRGVGPNSPFRLMLKRIVKFFGRHLVEVYIHLEYRVVFQQIITEFNPDIIHANDLDTLPTAVRVARSCKSKIVYDSHEIAIEEYPDQGLGHQLWRTFQERRLIHKADWILTPSSGVSDYLIEHYGVQPPTTIYNSPKFKWPENTMPDIRSVLGLSDDTPLIVFTGKLRLDRGMVPILHALALCEGFHFVRVGPSDKKLDIEILNLAQKLNVSERVHSVPAVPQSQVSPFISTADLAVICNQNLSLNFDRGMPNKLFEATFAGLPLAVSNLSLIRKFVEQHSVGMVMDQTDPEDIARVLKAVYRDKGQLAPSDDRLVVISNIYGWETQSRVLVEIYNDLLRQS